MSKEFIQRFACCFAELNSTENVMLVIVRGHLYCESALAQLLRTNLKHPEEMPIDRLEFQAKVNLCSALGLTDVVLKPGLCQLATLRNKYVHRLDYEATAKDQADLVNSIKSTLGPPAQFFLRRGTEFPNGFRRCVLALWLPLELHGATKEEAREMIEQLVDLMVTVSGKSEEEFRKELRADTEEFFAQRGEKMPSEN